METIQKFKFEVFRLYTNNGESLMFIGTVEAKDRNEACLSFRSGIYKNYLLTAKKVK